MKLIWQSIEIIVILIVLKMLMPSINALIFVYVSVSVIRKHTADAGIVRRGESLYYFINGKIIKQLQ